jgi:shikimate kinase
MMNDKNYAILAQNSVIILLNASAETVYARICRKNNRSLLPKGADLETVRQLINNNYDTYSKLSHYEVTVDKQDLDSVVCEIIAYYKSHL